MKSKLKYIVFAVAACAAVNALCADVNGMFGNPSLGSANVNAATLSDLKARMDESAEIIALLKALYEREVKTTSGRAKWHGKLVNQIINTNELKKVSVYADGKEFTDSWKLVTPIDVVTNRMKRLSVTTNGIPAKLAAARLRRAALEGVVTSNVVITVEVGKPGGSK